MTTETETDTVKFNALLNYYLDQAIAQGVFKNRHAFSEKCGVDVWRQRKATAGISRSGYVKIVRHLPILKDVLEFSGTGRGRNPAAHRTLTEKGQTLYQYLPQNNTEETSMWQRFEGMEKDRSLRMSAAAGTGTYAMSEASTLIALGALVAKDPNAETWIKGLTQMSRAGVPLEKVVEALGGVQ